jgi:N-acetylglutamate synthase
VEIKVKITKMKLGDYDDVISLWQNTEGMGLHQTYDSKKAIAKYLRRNPGLSLVALDSNQIVGAVLCGHDGRRGHLYHLAVVPAYRKRGIGKALVNQALLNLAAAGITRCTICAFTKNHAGRKFWTHIGWKERPDLRMFIKGFEK